MTTILGIDPGSTGAIAQVCPMVEIWPMPSTPHDLASLLRTFDRNTTRVYLERAQAMPGKARAEGRVEMGAHMFNYGRGYGQIVGILAALELWFVEVAAVTWKAALGLTGEDKAASVDKARAMWPEANMLIRRTHGRAEALLIAEYGRRKGEQAGLFEVAS